MKKRNYLAAALLAGVALATASVPAKAETGAQTPDERVVALYWTSAFAKGRRNHAATFDIFYAGANAGQNRAMNYKDCQLTAELHQNYRLKRNSSEPVLYWCEPGRFHEEAAR